MHLLIDGYNLVHVVGADRDDLLELLHLYQTDRQVAMSVVFDGAQKFMGSDRRDRYGAIDIYFSRPGESADELIEELCSKSPGQYVVVSDDREVQDHGEKHRCLSLSSQEFSKRLRSSAYPKLLVQEVPELEDKDEEALPLYPRVSTKKKGAAKKLNKRERRKFSQLKHL